MDINVSAIQIAKEAITESENGYSTISVDVLKELVTTIESIKYAIDNYAVISANSINKGKN